eukprot:scaffold15888_cov256-Skeletonema_menzelii.AAC.1
MDDKRRYKAIGEASRQEKCLCKGGDCYDDAITIVKIVPLFVAWQNRKTHDVYPGRRQTDQYWPSS